jgi:hemoglobin
MAGSPETAAKSLYERLGGYDAIAAVSRDLVARLRRDPLLGRFWQHRGSDGIARETQLLVDYLCAAAGGPMYYTGRDMKLSHQGMRISDADWRVFIGHLEATLDAFAVAAAERADVLAFIDSTKADIVEA